MAAISWPATLPPASLVTGFSERFPNVLLRTPNDTGPANVRRRYTAGSRVFDWPMVLTTAQVATFRSFVDTTILGRALVFDIGDPYTSSTIDVRMVDPPAVRALGKGYWRVTAVIETV